MNLTCQAWLFSTHSPFFLLLNLCSCYLLSLQGLSLIPTWLNLILPERQAQKLSQARNCPQTLLLEVISSNLTFFIALESPSSIYYFPPSITVGSQNCKVLKGKSPIPSISICPLAAEQYMTHNAGIFRIFLLQITETWLSYLKTKNKRGRENLSDKHTQQFTQHWEA